MTGSMRYISTRGQAPIRDFSGVLLAGLAEDGGLYLPESWPQLLPDDWRALRGLPYPLLAARILAPFTAGSIDAATLERLCVESLWRLRPPGDRAAGAARPRTVRPGAVPRPDARLQGPGDAAAGPAVRPRADGPPTGASPSSAPPPAIPARRRSRPAATARAMRLVMLHPLGRTSEVQRRQMTTVLSPNIANLAVRRQLRRLPGPGEGDVRRRAVPQTSCGCRR